MDLDEEVVGSLPRHELVMMERNVFGHAQAIASAMPLSHLSHLPYLTSSICSNAFCV